MKNAIIEIEKQKSLSDSDKERIKEALLRSAAENTNFLPEYLAESLIKGFLLVDNNALPESTIEKENNEDDLDFLDISSKCKGGNARLEL